MRLLLIDNHDSFSAILHHYLWELTGVRPLFYRNDALTRDELKALEFDAAVLSPGPGHPSRARDFGICKDLLELYPALPVLGVCLGHQGLAEFSGGKIIPLINARHGRPSQIRHDGKNLFLGLPQDFQAVRYHSLIVDAESLPENIRVTAWSQEDEQVMGLEYSDRPWFGVQFHPESIGTEFGKALLANFLEIAQPGSVQPETKIKLRKHPKIFHDEIPFRELSWKEPADIFASYFANAPASFWLDGSTRSENNVGWPTTIMGRANSVFEGFSDLKEFQEWYDELNLAAPKDAPWPGYRGGPIGYFEYEYSGRWMIPEAYLIFDHETSRVFAAWEESHSPEWLKTLIETWEQAKNKIGSISVLPPFKEWKPLLNEEEYRQRVQQIQKWIAEGETYEACLTHAFSVEAEADALEIFQRLRGKNPAPYAAYLAFPDFKLLSVSPELFLELSPEKILRSRPMKGTRPRGDTPDDDSALREDLLTHPKDRAENLMIVDLMRHDFSRVCELNSVEVPRLMEVETHPVVFQLVSEVQGRLEERRHPLESIESCFPGGSMTGAPKERTMELLATIEKEPRGAFSGALGYFTHGGSFNLSMVIRTLENEGNKWRVGCGGAVLADSDPDAERREATLKARSVIDAVGGK